jgi:hypothetical protein
VVSNPTTIDEYWSNLVGSQLVPSTAFGPDQQVDYGLYARDSRVHLLGLMNLTSSSVSGGLVGIDIGKNVFALTRGCFDEPLL